MLEFTGGDWFVDCNHDDRIMGVASTKRRHDLDMVCTFPHDAENVEVNAHLISAAKDLFAACAALPVFDIENPDPADFKDHAHEFVNAMRLARAAIDKAMGEEPQSFSKEATQSLNEHLVEIYTRMLGGDHVEKFASDESLVGAIHNRIMDLQEPAPRYSVKVVDKHGQAATVVTAGGGWIRIQNFGVSLNGECPISSETVVFVHHINAVVSNGENRCIVQCQTGSFEACVDMQSLLLAIASSWAR